MPVSINNTQVVFNDSTTQGTSFTGARGQVFNASGTFTIPTGITAIKATVVGGGGAGAGANPGCCGNLIAGNAGGASSLASGTQSISTITGNGGGGGSNTTGAVGNGTGGALNFQGGANSRDSFGGGTSYGGASFGNLGISGGAAGSAVQWFTGLTPGSTLTVTRGAAGTSGAGTPGPGVVYIEW
jgi:hypothetical protein